MQTRSLQYAQLFTRVALSVTLLSAVADRFGIWGPIGTKGVAWGNWWNFLVYTAQLAPYAGMAGANTLGLTATALEFTFAILLLVGLKTQWTAIGTSLLMLTFAFSMAFTSGPEAPLSYSVWVDAAAAALLASIGQYRWSFDAVLNRPRRH